MNLERAIDIIAQHVVAAQCERAEWENYSEIGEHYWQRVMDALPYFPLAQDYRDAMEFLAGRVSNDQEDWGAE